MTGGELRPLPNDLLEEMVHQDSKLPKDPEHLTKIQRQRRLLLREVERLLREVAHLRAQAKEQES